MIKKKTIQELSDTIKKSNIRVMGIRGRDGNRELIQSNNQQDIPKPMERAGPF